MVTKERAGPKVVTREELTANERQTKLFDPWRESGDQSASQDEAKEGEKDEVDPFADSEPNVAD